MSENEFKIESLNEAISLKSEELSVKVQKIYSTPHFICLTVREPGKTKNLYIGRGGKYQLICLGEIVPPSPLRTIDKFLEFLRAYVRNKRISKFINLDDRCLLIKLVTKESESYLGLAIFENRLAFSYTEKNKSGFKTFVSWSQSKKKNHDDLMAGLTECYESLGKTKPPVFDSSYSIETYVKAQLEDGTTNVVVKKYKKTLERKIKNIQGDILKLREEPALRSKLDKNEIDVKGVLKVKVLSWTFKFWPSWSDGKKRSQIYEKLKGLKRGLVVQTERLDKLKNEHHDLECGNLEKITFPNRDIIQPIWRSQADATHKSDSKLDIKEFNLNNIKGAIGSTARGNDHLRTSWASKSNMWFHIENYTGPHVVLKIDAISEISMEEISAIASMMRDKSNLSIQEIGLIYTQVKYLKAVKGTAGKVTFKKIKHLSLIYNPEWMEIISVI